MGISECYQYFETERRTVTPLAAVCVSLNVHGVGRTHQVGAGRQVSSKQLESERTFSFKKSLTAGLMGSHASHSKETRCFLRRPVSCSELEKGES